MDQTNIETMEADISFFDVKHCYDRAYEVKESDKELFRALMALAVKMDLAYRRQLRAKKLYKNDNNLIEKEFFSSSSSRIA